MRERRVELSAQMSLAVQQWGEPTAPPLLMLHGWLDNAASFSLLAPRLAHRWQVLALELPGHGHSDHLPPGDSYHYIDYVTAVLAATEALGLQRYALLGHSLGAGVASLVAAARPQQAERLWLIEGLGPVSDDGEHTLQRFRDALAAPTERKPQRVFRSIEQAVSARTLASGLPAEQARPIVQRGLREVPDGWQWRSDPRLTRSSPVRLAESQVLALLAGIEAPVSLLLAEPAAPYLPRERMQRRAQQVASIATQTMPGGHHLQLEHPADVAAWVLA